MYTAKEVLHFTACTQIISLIKLLLTKGGVLAMELIATVDGIVLATQSRLLAIPVENNFGEM